MELRIIDDDGESEVHCIFGKPLTMAFTLRPICIAHEVSHVKLGHTTMEGLAWRRRSYSYLLLQELACWQYVFALNNWDVEDMQFAFSCLENTIQSLGIEGKAVRMYNEFKDEHLSNV